MHRRWCSGVLLVVLAAPIASQTLLISTTPPVERPSHWARAEHAQAIRLVGPFARTPTDTATPKSRRRLIVGTAIGAVLGFVPGGTYAFLEATSGCKVTGSQAPCSKPGHLWVYPVGGAAAGAVIGALVARFW